MRAEDWLSAAVARRFFTAFILAALSGTACWFVAGNSLDLFIGAVFFAVILAPPLSASAGQTSGAVAVVIGITLGLACPWWTAVHVGAVSVGQWRDCLAILSSLVLMIALWVRLSMRLGASGSVASAAITLIALLWLTWPVWLSGSLEGSQLHWSVLFHPIFAINHVVAHLGIWTEQPIAYNLTNLGQDAAYQLPTSAWPVIGLQIAMAVIAGVLTELLPGDRSTRSTPTPP